MVPGDGGELAVEQAMFVVRWLDVCWGHSDLECTLYLRHVEKVSNCQLTISHKYDIQICECPSYLLMRKRNRSLENTDHSNPWVFSTLFPGVIGDTPAAAASGACSETTMSHHSLLGVFLKTALWIMAFFQILPWKKCRCWNRPCQPRVVESSVFWLDHWEIWGPSQRCWGVLTHLCEAQDQQTLDPKNYSGVGTYGDIFFVLWNALCFTAPPPKKKTKKQRNSGICQPFIIRVPHHHL